MASSAIDIRPPAQGHSGSRRLSIEPLWSIFSETDRPAENTTFLAPPAETVAPKPRSNFWAAAFVVTAHVMALTAAFTYRYHHMNNQDAAKTVILLPNQVDDTPVMVEEESVVFIEQQPDVYVPAPIIEIDRPQPATVAVTTTPPSAAPVIAPAPRVSTATAAPAPRPATLGNNELVASLLKGVPPKYPLESRRHKEEGTVVLHVTVGKDGLVEDIRVQTSSGHNRLDSAALRAVRKWQWQPFLQDGLPAIVHGLIEIPFHLTRT